MAVSQHSEQTKAIMAQRARDSWARLTPAEREARKARMRRPHKTAQAPAPPSNGSLRQAVEEARNSAPPSNGHELTELLDRLRLGFAAVLDLLDHRAAAIREVLVPPPVEVAGDPLALTILREAVALARAGDDHDEWTRAYEALCLAAIAYSEAHPGMFPTNNNTTPAARPGKATK